MRFEYLNRGAHELGFSSESVRGSEFFHRIYIKNGQTEKPVLHVYLDGDGQPWIGRRLVSVEPTPTDTMVLELMAFDSAPSIYLGRPCYHGYSKTPPCEPSLWTSARYSEPVVNSMQQVLQNYLTSNGYQEVVLIGFSGGGALAMLLAERISQTSAVVTIAGNLDTDAWASYHAYSALEGSLNPANRPPLNPAIDQYHLIGGEDSNVPYHLSEAVIERQSNARIRIWNHFDHACCWREIWREFLECLEKQCARP